MKLQGLRYGGIYVQAPFTPADVRYWVGLNEHARRRISWWFKEAGKLEKIFSHYHRKLYLEEDNDCVLTACSARHHAPGVSIQGTLLLANRVKEEYERVIHEVRELIDQYWDVQTRPFHVDACVESLLKRAQEGNKCRGCGIHYLAPISDDLMILRR